MNWLRYQTSHDIVKWVTIYSNYVVWMAIKLGVGILGSAPVLILVWMYKTMELKFGRMCETLFR